MLAMVVNDNDGCLNARGVWTTIASMLAPTGICASAINVGQCPPLSAMPESTRP